MSKSNSGPTSTTITNQQTAGAQVNAAPAPSAQPEFLYVIDTTAIPHDPQVAGSGPRTHVMPVNGQNLPFTFKPGEPTKLPRVIAVKFLKHAPFVCTDEQGQPAEYERQPKQPEEMGAGERFIIGDNETVARFTELHSKALIQRAVELPGGEKYIGTSDRNAVIAFLTAHKREQVKAAPQPTSDSGIGRDEGFTPEFDADDEAA